ncbi:hypothetical protein [Streptosporangium lutulentum]|uniref:Dihydrofolate reductase n=1 Tax=Streptosporangium lutulentum TaxID=1461250 RepID=A0ABT9QL99_9ACTN|nr:hypothetical protein [Streptosporangium lutulentum]MDP9847145.1 hypothetical protein [Streptosporangium lutulentum]
MRRIIASTYATLDGFIDNPHEWSMKYSDAESQHYASSSPTAPSPPPSPSRDRRTPRRERSS